MLIILVFNIKLTNGSINGFVFYCQIITIVYPGLTLNVMFSAIKNIKSYNPCNDNNPSISGPLNYNTGLLYLFPCNIFNLDFITVFPSTLCIQSNMTPLGALSFWYVMSFYPLLLMLLLYIWILMYDNGFRCVVTITRPVHCLLAHFWRMTNIEPSLTHSIASIYLLSFTQLAATSFKLLHATKWSK